MPSPVCPKCNEEMIQRNSKFGPFWGCPQYPKCKGTRKFEPELAPAASAALEKVKAEMAAEMPPAEIMADDGIEVIPPSAATSIPPRPEWLQLDEHQEAVVAWKSGPAVVAAGAGSGKSTCLIERIATLLETGAIPEHILTLVYNAAAAKDLKAKCEKRFGPGLAKRIQSFTFHGWAYRQLKIMRPGARYLRIDRVIGTDDGPSAYKLGAIALRTLQLSGELSDYLDASGRIREALCRNPLDVYAQGIAPTDAAARTLWSFTTEYQKVKKEYEAIDFADMLVLLCDAIRDGKAEGLKQAYAHVQIDECQDINPARMLIAKHIGHDATSFVAVGDLRQSIYGFSGATPALFKGLLDDGATLLTLPINRRSTAAIVALSNIISAGRDWNLGGECFPAPGAPAGKPVVFRSGLEGAFIGDEILAKLNAGEPLTDASGKARFALLVRTNAQAAVLEAALMLRKIPVRIVGTTGGMWSSNIGRDFVAYLHGAAGRGTKDVKRISNKPLRYIKGADIDAVLAAEGAETDLLNILSIVGEARLQSWQRSKGHLHALTEFSVDLQDLWRMTWEDRCKTIADYLLKDVADRTANTKAPPDDDREDLIVALRGLAIDAGSLEAIEQQIEESKKVNVKTPAVEISTIHKSKGAEWEIVFVTGVDVGSLPHANAQDVEEERRLFYVACTRAKSELFVTQSGADDPVAPGFFLEAQNASDTVEAPTSPLDNGTPSETSPKTPEVAKAKKPRKRSKKAKA